MTDWSLVVMLAETVELDASFEMGNVKGDELGVEVVLLGL